MTHFIHPTRHGAIQLCLKISLAVALNAFASDGEMRIDYIAALPSPCRDGCSLQMMDSQSGWLFSHSYGHLWKTRNAGITWQELTIPSVKSPTVAEWAFTSDSEGSVLAGTGLYETTDSGNHWVAQALPKFDGVSQSVWALLESHLVWVGGGIFEHSSGPDAPNYAVKKYDSGEWGVLRPVVYSRIGSSPWVKHDLPSCAWSIFGLKFWNSRQGYAFGDAGCFYYTEDGGNQWTLGQFHGPNDSAGNDQGTLHTITFRNEDNGWISFDDHSGSLYRTQNGGKYWQQIATGFPHFNALQFADESHGTAIAGQKELYESFDGGSVWTRVATDFLPRSVSCAEDRSCWVLSDGGLYRLSWH